ncbi:signal peptidase II [Kocuria palustris]|uniref:signal peptidase II n=1 Tax=Kocuria palustris TaxID=71999 RepID=UPI003CF25432
MSSPASGQRPRSTAARTRGRGAALILALLCAAAVYGLDQGTKALVERTMTLGQQIPVIDGLLQWHYILNPGAAFSMGEGFTWVFTAIMAIVSIGILIYLPRVRSLVWAVSLGLVLGGASGNLTDRLLRWPGFPNGHVVDFIHVQGFAVFNVADSGVVVGVILTAALILFGREPDGTRSGRDRPGTEGTGSAEAPRTGSAQNRVVDHDSSAGDASSEGAAR